MAKTGARVLITLACTECQDRNYHSEKNRRNSTERIELTKFCKKCRKRVIHRETRWKLAKEQSPKVSEVRPSRLSGLKLGRIGEIISELKKTRWPSRSEATRLTLLVLAISGAIGIILGIIDMGFSRLFEIISEG